MTPPEFYPSPYPELNEVLHEMAGSIRTVLCDDLIAAYLQGSLAVGGFDEHSDVDFVILIKQELSDSQVQELQSMHGRIFDLDSEWAKHLEGSYFPEAILRDYTRSGEDLWYLEHGDRALIRSDHCNTVVVRWTLREHGVVMIGPRPSSLIEPIPTAALRRAILEDMNEWGREILTNPEKFSNRFYQGFIVLNYCRMLHDLRAGTCGSKRTGAEWAKRHLDQSWSGLIDRTWACRPDPATSVRQPADKEDFRKTLRFVQEVTEAANALAESESYLGNDDR